MSTVFVTQIDTTFPYHENSKKKKDLFVHFNFFLVFGALLRLAELAPPDSVNDESD